ncbi:MAG TPA: hypothetical protein PLK33_03050 [bacterium]|nr:hypothetical protein [bacterium]
MRELNKFISRVRLKIRSVLFFNWLLELYIYLSAIYIVNYFFHLDVSYYYLLIPVFFAIFLSLVRPIDNRDVAIIIDKDLGLNERVITSLEFNGLDSPIVKRLISETVDMLRNLNIKNVYPFRFRKRLKYLLLIPPLLFLSLSLYQNVFYPGEVSPQVEESGVSRISMDLITLQQKLVPERPDLAKRLEVLRKEMEEKRITSKEGINILEEITKEIDNTPAGNMDSNARADIKKTLELVMEGMNDKGMSPATDNENSRKEEPQDSSGEGTGGKGMEAGGDKPVDEEGGKTSPSYTGEEEDTSGAMSNEQGEQTGINEEEKSGADSAGGQIDGSAGDSGEEVEKEGTLAGSDTVEEGGTLPGKGERDNKLGEETGRNQVQNILEYVPGIAKEEGGIKLKIKGSGKETSPAVEGGTQGAPVKSVEDPVEGESIPYEYKEMIRIYFERLKGE